MSSRTFYLCASTLGIIGIVIAIDNADNQSYLGRCWFTGGVALFVVAIVVPMIILGLRTKTSSSNSYTKKIPLVGLATDDEEELMAVRYIDGSRVVSATFRKSIVRIVNNSENDSEMVAILKIDGLKECYTYRFWFIYWPEKTVTMEAYTLLISKPFDEVLDFYEACRRR